MSSYWQVQAQIASGELATAAGRAGRDYIDRKNQEQFDKQLQKEYRAALEKAKKDGLLPEKFQHNVPEDVLGAHVAVKVIALRELAKFAPDHPLVVSQKCQDVVSNLTLRQFNRLGRGSHTTYAASAPDASTADDVFDYFRKNPNA